MRTVASCGGVYRNVAACLASLMLAVAIAGCAGASGAKLAPVTGKVTQGGEPLAGADVMFIPESGAPSGGRTDDSGRFELVYNDGRPGAVPGKHQVVISEAAPEGSDPGGGAEPPPTDVEPPAEFREEAEVKADGENDFTFEVGQ